MKSVVLLLVLLEIILSLAQIGNNLLVPRRAQWIQRPQQHVQLCQIRGIPSNTWPKIGMNDMILSHSAPSNTAWRTSQVGKIQNQRYPLYRYHWIPPPQQKVHGCLIPPHPWSGLRTSQLILPPSAPSNPAWRTNQVGKTHYHWTGASLPQPKVQGCLIPPNPWPKLGTNQLILPPSSPSNVGWRSNQGMFNWMNPFYFGLPNYYPHWGYQQHYPSSIFNRYPPRLPVASNLGMPLSLPIQPTIHRQWNFGSPPGRWQMQFFGSPQGLWHFLPQIAPTDPPYYIAHRI